MKSRQEITVLAALAALTLWAAGTGAQVAQAQADSARATSDSGAAQARADSGTKKRGGMLSRVRGLARNRTVQTVAKVAACTVVPGGQLVAGAIDAAASKSATGAASGVAAAATGTACMPGMAGAAGAGAAGGLAGTVGSVAAGSIAGAAANAQAQAAMRAAMGAGAVPGGAALAGAATVQAMSAVQALAAAQAAQAMSAQMAAQMQAMNAATAGMATEAAGQRVQLSGDAAAELRRGKLVIRRIDWVREAPIPSPATTAEFVEAMTKVSQAMRQVGGRYRVDIYMDGRYPDVIVTMLGQQRLALVISALQDGEAGSGAQVGNAQKGGEQRLEIVRLR